ncbi:hypothetical protein [Luethyella okanaganae]|uniref:Uncharacterized protein n=1 Tax=Luethyella okanaganae TaxID=69372 RepID=A0ABW1VDS3_9MICO
MRESTRDVVDTRPVVPELGWPLVLSLVVLTAVTAAAGIWMVQGQGVPIWLTSLLMVVVIVDAFSLPALNRRARAARHIPAWGRKFSAVVIGAGVVVPLAALFPAALDPHQWGWVMIVIAGFEVALLLVSAGVSVRLRQVAHS